MDIKIDEIVKQVLSEIGTQMPAAAEKPAAGRTAVLTAPEAYELKSFPIPSPGGNEILVRVEGCMVSRRDTAEFIREKRAGGSAAAGQEGTGVILAMGSDSVKDAAGRLLRVGDRVVAVKRTGFSGTYGGNAKPEIRTDGWFSDHVLLKDGSGVYQANGLDQESRLLTGTAAAVGSAVNRAAKLAKLTPSGTAVVMGCAMEGLMAAAILKCRGVANIVALDAESKKDIAREFGAAHFISSQESGGIGGIKEKLEKAAGSLADVVFICSSSPVAKSVARRLVKTGGNICELTYVLGNGREASRYYEESLPAGGRFYTAADYENTFAFLAEAAKKEIPMYRLITHRYKLEEVNEAHWAALRGDGMGIAVFNR